MRKMIITLSAVIALLSLLAGCGNLANVTDKYQDNLQSVSPSKFTWLTWDCAAAPAATFAASSSTGVTLAYFNSDVAKVPVATGAYKLTGINTTNFGAVKVNVAFKIDDIEVNTVNPQGFEVRLCAFNMDTSADCDFVSTYLRFTQTGIWYKSSIVAAGAQDTVNNTGWTDSGIAFDGTKSNIVHIVAYLSPKNSSLAKIFINGSSAGEIVVPKANLTGAGLPISGATAVMVDQNDPWATIVKYYKVPATVQFGNLTTAVGGVTTFRYVLDWITYSFNAGDEPYGYPAAAK